MFATGNALQGAHLVQIQKPPGFTQFKAIKKKCMDWIWGFGSSEIISSILPSKDEFSREEKMFATGNELQGAHLVQIQKPPGFTQFKGIKKKCMDWIWGFWSWKKVGSILRDKNFREIWSYSHLYQRIVRQCLGWGYKSHQKTKNQPCLDVIMVRNVSDSLQKPRHNHVRENLGCVFGSEALVSQNPWLAVLDSIFGFLSTFWPEWGWVWSSGIEVLAYQGL